MEEKIARLEGIMEQVVQRLNHVETEISELRTEIGELRSHVGTEIRMLRNQNESGISNLRDQVKTEVTELRTEINTLRDKIDSNFKWTLGILITMWITIIITVLLKK